MQTNRLIHLFVPGRLCLFGEHSDWAGMYRSINSAIPTGAALVSGTEQGIYAVAEKADQFIMSGALDFAADQYWECEMDSEKLLTVARSGGFYSYVAGVASYINDNYTVGGVKITVLKQDLPVKSGLSSSAAICVLVARAFNQLYGLKMNIKGEMQAAFRGEQRTPSRCGRLDQACAYGVKPVLMDFDGVEIDSRELRVGTTFHWVIANLMASKDTIKILADLNKAYPFAQSEADRLVQEALGRDNQEIVSRAIWLLEAGRPEELGKLMREAQQNFDSKVAPACSELTAPVLHSVLNDPEIEPFVYGGKGVGSQGDGTVQFLAKGEEEAKALQDYLLEQRGMPSFTLTLKPGQTVKKAIIPLAGFGTRVFPATKTVRKCFLPLLDTDGLLKPALMIMMNELLEAGIEEICLIIWEDEQELMRLFPDRAGLRCENRHIVLSREHSTVVEMSHSTPPRLDENDFVRDLDAAVRVFCNGEQAFETELRADHYHEAYAALSRLYGRCFRLERQALDYPNGRAARFTNYPALSALSLLSFSYAAMHGGLTRALRVERILRRLQKGDAEAACIGFAQETD